MLQVNEHVTDVEGSGPSRKDGPPKSSSVVDDVDEVGVDVEAIRCFGSMDQYNLTGSLSVSMAAIAFFWTEPIMSDLISPDSEIPGLTTSDTSWLAASIEIGELFVTIPAGLLADRYGRKPLILSSGPMIILGWILTLTTRSLWVLYAVRLLHGMVVAVVFTVVPIYMAEIAEPRIRGEISSHFMTFWYLGTLFNYCVGPYFSYQNFTYMCNIVPVVFTVMFAFMPETPFYYLMIREPEKSMESLKWLRYSEDVGVEFKAISETVEREMKNKGTWRNLIATKADVKALLIVQMVCCVRYLNGMAAIMSYATETFRKGTSTDPHVLSITLGAILCTSTFITAFFTDRIGRRPLLLASLLGSVTFNAAIALYYYTAEFTEVAITDYFWLMFIAVVGFCISANIGLNPLMQTIQAEYFPSNTRALAGGVTELTASVAAFINIKQYQVITDAFGIYMNYVIFAFTGIVGLVLVYTLLEETAGTSLGEIQQGHNKTECISETVPA